MLLKEDNPIFDSQSNERFSEKYVSRAQNSNENLFCDTSIELKYFLVLDLSYNPYCRQKNKVMWSALPLPHAKPGTEKVSQRVELKTFKVMIFG